jgi:hypothetical protein
MPTINQRTNVGGIAAVTPSQAGVPAWLSGLLAVNPKLAHHYKTDPGLRAFLDANKANLVEWTSPPPGRVADRVTWEVWCHATATVPASVRDEEYIIVVARGAAYRNADEVTFPLQNGRAASSDGRIVFVGKTGDYLGQQRPADEGGAYPGAIAVQIHLPVAGPAGESVSLAYCRAKPDTSGRMHPSHSGWPDSFVGVFGGYSGRELELRVAGGRRQFADAPLGCSQPSVGRFV